MWWLGGQNARPADHVDQPPLTQASPPRVDMWRPRLGANRLKPWPCGRPLGPFSLEFGLLGPRVKYTPTVMMILTFGQIHFVIP
jgi:hypothetical protein